MKNHSRHLHAPLSVIFAPNSVNVARYVSLIRHKSPISYPLGAKWAAHLSESIWKNGSLPVY
ncbi:hypothetical protein D3Z47_09370 [Lachnospiraceae bacterium]|nr:hypothetical protein [Lachnospiraceae bacterium]